MNTTSVRNSSRGSAAENRDSSDIMETVALLVAAVKRRSRRAGAHSPRLAAFDAPGRSRRVGLHSPRRAALAVGSLHDLRGLW